MGLGLVVHPLQRPLTPVERHAALGGGEAEATLLRFLAAPGAGEKASFVVDWLYVYDVGPLRRSSVHLMAYRLPCHPPAGCTDSGSVMRCQGSRQRSAGTAVDETHVLDLEAGAPVSVGTRPVDRMSYGS